VPIGYAKEASHETLFALRYRETHMALYHSPSGRAIPMSIVGRCCTSTGVRRSHRFHLSGVHIRLSYRSPLQLLVYQGDQAATRGK
jgi:hypothetical protein